MRVFIGVYDRHERLVKTLCNGERKPGKHVLEWDGTSDTGRKVASGTYYLHVDMENVGTVARYRIVLS